MIAMHYGFVLPADRDMDGIRSRVVAKAPLFDRYPGLVLKAFLARDARRTPGQSNYYGAFYVWRDDAAADAFLRSEAFAAFVSSFGRPVVHRWPIVSMSAQPHIAARHATIELTAGGSPSHADPTDPSHAAIVVAGDARQGRAVRLDLWSTELPPNASPDAGRFEVLHVSRPDLVPAGFEFSERQSPLTTRLRPLPHASTGSA